MTSINNQATDSTNTSRWSKLRAKFSKAPFDYEKWWNKKRNEYREAWNCHKDKDRAIAIAEKELARRDGDLKATATRTTLLLTFSGLLLAGYSLAFQADAISQTILFLAKVGVGFTAGALLVALNCIRPMWHAWRGRSMPAAVHSKLMRYKFDEYAWIMLYIDRVGEPLDRLKHQHWLAVALLAPAIAVAAVAYFAR